MVEPEVVIRYRHLVEGDLLRVLEEAVGPPNVVQPVDVEDPVLLRHVFRQPQPRVPPALREKYVRHVGLPKTVYHNFIVNSKCLVNGTYHGLFVDGVDAEYGDVEVDDGRLAQVFGCPVLVIVLRVYRQNVPYGERDLLSAVVLTLHFSATN